VQEKIKDLLGLTKIANEKLRIEEKRIEWNHIFLLEALLWSFRSHDPQTKHGCVLVRDKTVLSTGYNGFISEVDDTQLPNLRPYKYDFMVHAEHNAILNCVRNGVSTLGAKAYITGAPCNSCLQYMWQAGINEIFYSDFSNTKMIDNEEYVRIQAALLILMNEKYTFNMTYIPSSQIDFSSITKIHQKFCIT
jgi:dCMP deaminase